MTEWSNARLAQAYALVEAVKREQPLGPDRSYAVVSLSDAMDAIELADCELVDAL